MAAHHFDLVHLRTFLTVARLGSFTDASGDLGLTQSAVSRQMKDLEGALDAGLFERFGRGVHLTVAGQTLVEHAEAILLQAEDTRRAMQEVEGGLAGEIRIGATLTAANEFLPPTLAKYHTACPRVRLILVPSSTTTLLKLLRRNELDLAITGHVPHEPDLTVWGTLRDRIVFAGARGHPLSGVRNVSPEQVAQQKLILRDTSSDTRRIVDRWADAAGIAVNPLMDMW